MNHSRKKRLEKAELKVLFNAPFFTAGVCKLPSDVIPVAEWMQRFGAASPESATACTDGKRIYWADKFFDGLSDEVLPTILCHEACHCMLGHLWRFVSHTDTDIVNRACDHAVNLMLKEFAAPMKQRGLADPFPFPPPPDSYCADPQFAGMAEEVIYQRLSQEKQKQPQTGNPDPNGKPGQGQGSGSPQGGGTNPQPGKSQGKPQSPQPPKPHSMPSMGQFIPPPQNGPGAEEAKKSKADWENTFIQSCKAAKAQGTLPGSMERILHELVSPTVPWWEVLRSHLRELRHDDYCWQRPAMEYSDSEFVLPSMHSESMGTVVFCSDWSGSTCGDLVTKFHAEKQSCLDECRPAKLVDFGFDTRVVSQREYFPGDLIDPKIKGGGGTSFVEVLQVASELQPRPKAIIILTDMEGSMGDDPGVPVIWINFGSRGATAPFGETIYAGE